MLFPAIWQHIYTSLSDLQVRLGEEFESAIFGDLDNLYID